MTLKKRPATELLEMSRAHYPRLLGLMEEAGIDIDRPDSWEMLAVILADRLKLLSEKGKVGRKAEWQPASKAALIQDFEQVMKAQACNASKAAKLLRNDKGRSWGRYSADTLEARYSDFKSEIAKQTLAKEISAEVAAERRPVQKR
jgi:hypothetical protein